MENKNKCFFSISLENGITITGINPNEVKAFLSELSLCIDDAIESESNDNYQQWKKHIIELKTQLDNAWLEIYSNQNKERE